jgi:glycosyltransferase involved in cell wall biosynthesis
MYQPKRHLGQRRGLKGHEDLIDSMAFVTARIPNAVCVMVGSAPAGAEEYERSIRLYAKRRRSCVLFVGHRSDVPALYPDFDVAVHPSHSENLGGALESLLLGVPTIATDVGGFRDIVIPGRTGWLVPPRSPEKLGAAIVEALLNVEQARQFAVAGRSLALSLLDVRRTAAEVKQVYLEVLRRSVNSVSATHATRVPVVSQKQS